MPFGNKDTLDVGRCEHERVAVTELYISVKTQLGKIPAFVFGDHSLVGFCASQRGILSSNHFV
jgi:hypothetical protein